LTNEKSNCVLEVTEQCAGVIKKVLYMLVNVWVNGKHSMKMISEASITPLLLLKIGKEHRCIGMRTRW